MGGRWEAARVLALAPDAASAQAGRRLATPASWSGTGASAGPAAVWGRCRGSGASPYQTVVDLAGPAFRCSCPSRKFPCKHALGLLLLWSSGHVPAAPAPPGFAEQWLAARQRAAAQAPDQPADPAAAARRAQQRADRVAAGLAELDQWLRDQVRTGLAGTDTAVVDLTDRLQDPVDVLFGTQLGGGTDINRALGYAQTLITRPTETLFILISDLYEGGNQDEMLGRVAALTASGVTVIALLALSDEGAPAYHRDNASRLNALGAPAFACTPDAFPDLLAAALARHDLTTWVQQYLAHQSTGP